MKKVITTLTDLNTLNDCQLPSSTELQYIANFSLTERTQLLQDVTSMMAEIGVETWPEQVLLQDKYRYEKFTIHGSLALYLEIIHFNLTPDNYFLIVDTPFDTLVSEFVSCAGPSWSTLNKVVNFKIFGMPTLRGCDGYEGESIPATFLYLISAYLRDPSSLTDGSLYNHESIVAKYLIKNLVEILKPEGRMESESMEALSIMKFLLNKYRNNKGELGLPKERESYNSLIPELISIGFDEKKVKEVMERL